MSALGAGATPTVGNGGSSSAAVFNFGIPAGATGATGPAGPTTNVYPYGIIGSSTIISDLVITSIYHLTLTLNAMIITMPNCHTGIDGKKITFIVPGGLSGNQSFVGQNGDTFHDLVSGTNSSTYLSLFETNPLFAPTGPARGSGTSLLPASSRLSHTFDKLMQPV